MNTKLFEQLKEKCKSFGLTKKGIEALTELGEADLTEESTDDDIAAKADLLVPFAKAMQGEITRKTRNKPSVEKQSEDEGNDEGNDNGGDGIPSWFTPFQQKMAELENENTKLKAERATSERASLIADKAKKLGIPECLVKHIGIADDADVDATLTSIKQDLVSNSLMPKEQAHEISPIDESQAKADAKAWAAGLSD